MQESFEFLKKILRKNILSLKPYSSARSETNKIELGSHIFLNANENPYRPFGINNDYNLYHQHQPPKLKKIVTELYQIQEEQILITRGSDEAIDILIRSFCEPLEDAILICNPTFGMYQFYANIQNAKIYDIPLDKTNGFQINLNEFYKINKKNIKLIFLPNPSAPLGHLLKEEDILTLCKIFDKKAMLVIDEAYIEFSKKQSFTKKLIHFPNLIILRTLSKAYAMAGLRLGFCIGSSQIIHLLKPLLSPYPLSAATIDLACKALQQKGLSYAKANIKKIIQGRENLKQEIQNLSFVKKIYPSEANFLFIQVKDSKKLLNFCEQYHMILRSFHSIMKNCIRISVGNPEQNQKLIQVFQQYEINT